MYRLAPVVARLILFFFEDRDCAFSNLIFSKPKAPALRLHLFPHVRRAVLAWAARGPAMHVHRCSHPKPWKQPTPKRFNVFAENHIHYLASHVNLAERKLFDTTDVRMLEPPSWPFEDENHRAVQSAYEPWRFTSTTSVARREPTSICWNASTVWDSDAGPPLPYDPGSTTASRMNSRSLSTQSFPEHFAARRRPVGPLLGMRSARELLPIARHLGLWKTQRCQQQPGNLGAKFTARHPTWCSGVCPVSKCGHDAPVYSVVDTLSNSREHLTSVSKTR